MLYLTDHAYARIRERFIDFQDEILGKLESVSLPYSHSEVRVIIKSFSSRAKLPDNTQGDFIIACVSENRVKTVMLQRALQVKKQSQRIKYFDIRS